MTTKGLGKIRIRNSGLRSQGSGSERNNYGSATLESGLKNILVNTLISDLIIEESKNKGVQGDPDPQKSDADPQPWETG